MGIFDPNMPQSERAALVGNELDSALASAIDNFERVRNDPKFSTDCVRDEVAVIQALDTILDLWPSIAPYIL